MRGASAAKKRHWVEDVPGVRPGPMPELLAPELPTLVDVPPAGDAFFHEIKLDGYRLFCRVERGRARLFSRRGNDLTARFPRITRAAEALPVEAALLDGEAVILLPDGRTSFQALQGAFAGGRAEGAVYFAFDLLHLDGFELCAARLEDRKHALERVVLTDEGPLRRGRHLVGSGPELFANACRLGLEGLVSKRRDAVYRPGRSKCWFKAKCLGQQEFVIVGYTLSSARGPFGALLLGVHDEEGNLVYAGRVGTGFSDRDLLAIGQMLASIERKSCPLHGPRPGPARVVRWVEPILVAEVRFTEWTDDGHLRHPSFRGLRFDKRAEEIVRERPARTPPAR
jgi:bifunctional non-homologous end joining protein LigD